MDLKSNFLIRWWQTPKLPIVHIWIPKEKRPKGIKNIIRVYFRKWTVHPLKRRIAKYYLVFLRKFCGLKVIGITGSAGKTTTKEMLLSILDKGAPTIASFANIDPVYNIPTTILRCSPKTKFLILEMGIEYKDEMDYYLWLATPDVGIITNIFPTHLLFLGNVEGVAKEKTKLVKAISKNGYAILNKENKFLSLLNGKLQATTIFYGENTNFSAKNVKINNRLQTEFELNIKGTPVKVSLPTIGKQFIINSLAASAAAFSLGFSVNDIKKGLEKYSSPEHRMKILKHKSGATIIDDSYNNNPEAAKASFQIFNNFKNYKRTLVFGDMLELGSNEINFHKEIGRELGRYDLNQVICVGPLNKFVFQEVKKKNKNVIWVTSKEEILALIKPMLTKNSVILFKGSRSIGLDQVVSQLL